MCVCVYPSKRIHVAICGPIRTKFGTHMQTHLEKEVGKIKICPVSRRGIWGVLGGQKLKMWEICQMAGPISTKFGTHVRIHLGMDIDQKQLAPRYSRGHFGGFRGSQNAKVWKIYQTAGPIGTKFGTRLQIHMGMDIG